MSNYYKRNKDERINSQMGLMVIEVIDSNPNGDPNDDGQPRQTNDGFGVITHASVNRKVRDIIDSFSSDQKVLWEDLKNNLNLIDDDLENLSISEKNGRDRSKLKKMSNEEFREMFYDARTIGCTFLEKTKNGESFASTGAFTLQNGKSINKIEIEKHTLTNSSGVEDGKNQGFANDAIKYVKYGIYKFPFFVIANQVASFSCKKDIEIYLNVLPLVYDSFKTSSRANVIIRNIWLVESKYYDFKGMNSTDVMKILTPEKRADVGEISDWSDVEYKRLNNGGREKILEKFNSLRDIMEEYHDGKIIKL